MKVSPRVTTRTDQTSRMPKTAALLHGFQGNCCTVVQTRPRRLPAEEADARFRIEQAPPFFLVAKLSPTPSPSLSLSHTPLRCDPWSSSFSWTEACRRNPPGQSCGSRKRRRRTPKPSQPISRPLVWRVGAKSACKVVVVATSRRVKMISILCVDISISLFFVHRRANSRALMITPVRGNQKGSQTRRDIHLLVNGQEANAPVFFRIAKIQDEARWGRTGSA